MIIKNVFSVIGGLDEKNILEKISKIKKGSMESYQPFFVGDKIDYDRAMLIYSEFSNTPGVFLASKNKREYDLKSESLSHVIGYTGKINAEEFQKLDGVHNILNSSVVRNSYKCA